MNKQRKVYKILDKDGVFFQYIKASELDGAVRHFLKLDKRVTIAEAHISDDLFKTLFS
tara:strand:+ start:152 stop:325 length:174 start_codon:yes stop_codon:yes gene_type:complete